MTELPKHDLLALDKYGAPAIYAWSFALVKAYGAACRAAALEEAAQAAWAHFVDTAKKLRSSPTASGAWDAASAIRSLKESHHG